MSDFVFAARRRAPGDLRGCLEHFLAPASTGFVEHHGAWGSLAVATAPHDRRTIVDDGRFLSVLIGEPIVRSATAPAGLSRQEDRRRVVHDLLQTTADVTWDDHLDGHFALFGIDLQTGAGIAVTDLFAFIPLFAGTDDGDDLVIGTHVDAVARAAGRSTDTDPVSLTDLVATFVCTHPYTIYRSVEQFPAASARRIRDGHWEGDVHGYWVPREDNPYESPRAAAAALRAALLEDVRVACDGLREVGLLLSGGEDARAVLAAVPPGVRVRTFTYADWENREVRVARAVARAYGADVVFGRRAPDHYIAGMEAVASLIGSHNHFMDVHGWGFHERLALRDLPIVLGGLSADSLLKGYHVQPKSIPAVPGIRPDLLAAVAERHEAFRACLAVHRPESADEWTRLWPFTMRRHSGNLHGNRRLFASHEPFHASAIVKLAAAVPLAWKRHRKLYLEAMRPLFRRSWHVPHARWRFPYFGPYANLPLTAALRVARGVRALITGEVRARQGPWPKWREVAGSEAAQAKWRTYPVAGSAVAEIFEHVPESDIEAVVQRWHGLRQLLLLQLTRLTRRARD